MKYIVEFEDEPCMYEDEVHFYKCIQAPWWGLSERVIKQLTPYQPDAPDTNVGNIANLCAHENDPISRQMAIDTIMGQPPEPHYPSWYAAQIEKLPAAQPDHNADISEINKFIDGLEEILADIRERHVDDSVCGLCEYDGAYMGQSGDWCNECPGFDKDDCFKLSDETRKKWIEEIVNAYSDHIADIGKKVSISCSHENDLISRQTAIDAIAKQMPKSYTSDGSHPGDEEIYKIQEIYVDCIESIEILPAVQPDHVADISKKAEGDCISRQATIDALHTWFRDGFNEDKWWNSTHVLAAIEGMSPAQQGYKLETCFECPLSHGCPKIKGCTNEQAIERASQIPNDCPLSAQPEQNAYEQGRITGRVEMRTEILSALKEMVGSEVWSNV